MKHKIIIPDERKCDITYYLNEALEKVYHEYPKLKEKADEIHHRRLMSGDACCQCIIMALKELNWVIEVELTIKEKE